MQNEVVAVLERTDLSDAMREDILAFRQEIIDGISEELTITIFSENLLPSHMDTVPWSVAFRNTQDTLRPSPQSEFVSGRVHNTTFDFR